MAALWWLDRTHRTATRLRTPATPPPACPIPHTSRRTVLAAGTLAAAAAVMGGAGRWITSYRTRPADVKLPAAADPAGEPVGLDDKVPGITPFRTPNNEFYRVDTRLTCPS